MRGLNAEASPGAFIASWLDYRRNLVSRLKLGATLPSE